MTSYARRFASALLLASTSLPAIAQTAPAPPPTASNLEEAISKGKLILDARLRLELVDQDLLPENAAALTLRTRLGYETAAWEGFKALVEVEDVRRLSSTNFNNTFNGLTRYPVIADPSDTEINRAQLSWSGALGTSVIVGRQRLILDNARFIGNAGFRQNEQTFDAALVRTSFGVKGLALTYAYIDKVNRVFSDRSPNGVFRSDSHVFNASYEVAPALKLTGYAYLLELDTRTRAATTSSSQTYGVRASGTHKVGAATLAYAAEYASQSDYADNPRSFDLDYWTVEGTLAWKGLSAAIGHENLDGNGVQGFQTPLATLFAFNGWADVFLNTPGQGLTDTYARIGYQFNKVPVLTTVRTQLWYHDYGTATGPGDFGEEWNLLVQAVPNKRWTLEARLASYNGGSIGFADRTKVWVSAGYIF
jgi:hypothetical protein